MNTPSRPYGTVVEMLQLIGLDVTHEYDDLIFVSHNLFILKFAEDATGMDLYFNEEIDEEKALELMAKLEAVGELHGLPIVYRGAFGLEENEDDTVSVSFFDLTDE